MAFGRFGVVQKRTRKWLGALGHLAENQNNRGPAGGARVGEFQTESLPTRFDSMARLMLKSPSPMRHKARRKKNTATPIPPK